ncbi:RHOMBOID-like protein 10, chloroplastic isoform X2 [Manihot esculenta]|uniref:RHOMBOID-like protein 10, chloroplastic isoform X2 n=1 Tax=Manihot esculenta TaxID=3983 RepID=UPI000B5D8A97|nr:RHOMBOID-like protein 10, chloroplastic isoform X2 [Manihot esculenta]XP_021625628.1 RHOMBOID-like protein 10, chloroplastic isoform X2 [Manihot esculenta]
MVGLMGSSLSSSPPQPLWWVPLQQPGPSSVNLITTASSLHLGFLLHSSFKKLSHLCNVPRLKELWCEKASQFKGINFFELSNDFLASTCSPCLFFFNGGETGRGRGIDGSLSGTSRRNSFDGRKWTNVLLAINVLVFVAQMATQGKMLLWGAKINSLIDKGQLWRLATSSLLHANFGHLMINCYSLNSIGATIENLSGPRRFLAIYFTSAIASSATSYWFCKAPAVGASGAIFGLVGSLAVFIIRHRGMIRGGKDDLQNIARVILLNMVIGILSRGIDNWGHLACYGRVCRLVYKLA